MNAKGMTIKSKTNSILPPRNSHNVAQLVSKQPSVYDLHIHTQFSPDSSTPLDTYAQVAEHSSIHIGFLDHLELAFFHRTGFLNHDNLPDLLETYDQVHQRYPHTSLGLEVDFYSDQSSAVAEFCDEYRKDFDYLIGTVHTIDRLAVTVKEELELLINRIGLSECVHQYFDEVGEAIESKLFDGIAHIDGVMRFVPLFHPNTKLLEFWRQRTLELGKQCQKNGILIEINLSGLIRPWKRTHPSKDLIEELVQAGAQFFVGSDSHSLMDFKNAIPYLRQFHEFLERQNGLALPMSI